MKFFYVYKSLAHPELPATGLIQPITLEERLIQARLAEKKLGGTIPWLVDDIDNRFKRAMGDRPNSEFIINPDGVIVRKRAWSDPAAVRADLEQLVGKASTLTKPEEAGTFDILQATAKPAEQAVPRLSRAGLFPLMIKPLVNEAENPFYAKLRCEGDLNLIDQGEGKLYLGFNLDPLYEMHWNNLNEPLRYEIQVGDNVRLSAPSGQAERVPEEIDSRPREFLIDVKQWPPNQPLHITVEYSACTDKTCYVVKQSYLVRRSRDIDGGAAPTAAFRGLDAPGMVQLLLSRDRNGDGKLTPNELNSIQRPRFRDYDLNGDGVLDADEIEQMAVQNTSQKEL